MGKAETYEKFKVAMVKKTDERPTTVPITGIGMLMSYVKEKIEEWSKFKCD